MQRFLERGGLPSMSAGRATTEEAMHRLGERARLNIMTEEAAILLLLDGLELTGDHLPASHVEDVWHAVRQHRISIIRQRALMGALGQDV